MGLLVSTWTELNPGLRYLLAVGSTGRKHLTNLAVAALELGKKTEDVKDRGRYFRLAADLLVAAWEENPFDSKIAELLRGLNRRTPFLGSNLSNLIERLATVPEQHMGLTPFVNCVTQELGDFLSQPASRHGPLFHLWEDWLLSVRAGEDIERMRSILCKYSWPPPLDRLRCRLLAKLSLAVGDEEKWYEYLIHRGGTLSYADRCFAMARAAAQQGDRRRPLEFLKQGLIERPWCAWALLKAYDVMTNMGQRRSPLPGRVAIALYTYNKAKELEETLTHLASSELLGAKIFLLINGSTDNTRDIARQWHVQLGAERVHLIDLPINIGAPAARNWLLHDKALRDYDWIVYLDDDALVPRDWLLQLGAVARDYPNASAWGCRVVDAVKPVNLQSVDYHVLPPPEGDSVPEHITFALNMNHYETFDEGQFTYVRPCIHVTGCCHLFRRATAHDIGDFDLRFSPSQYDDLERDIRAALTGKYAIYNGHLAVRHKNRTAKETRISCEQRGSAAANLYKLYMKYSPDDCINMISWNRKLVEDDLLAKIREVENGLGFRQHVAS